jgi:hypothetical protein
LNQNLIVTLVLVKVRWEEKFSGSLEEGSVEKDLRL